MSLGLKFSEAQDPITWSYRDRTEGRGQSVERFIQVFPSDRLRAPVVNDRTCRRAEEENGIRNPGEHLRAKQRAIDDVLARLSEREEMTGEVAAVDRGYVFGIERAEVTRVIPVIEVTTETFEAVHRAERGFEPLDCSYGAEPAEIVRSDGGEQIQPEVGGRRAVGHDWLSALPGNCREEGRGLPGRQRSRRTARSGARLAAECERHLPKEAQSQPRAVAG